jgi:seryl-tRNA synthetase
MGLDVNELRPEKGGNPDRIRDSCKKRGKDPALVDQLIEIDVSWRKTKFDLDQLRKEYNAINI